MSIGARVFRVEINIDTNTLLLYIAAALLICIALFIVLFKRIKEFSYYTDKNVHMLEDTFTGYLEQSIQESERRLYQNIGQNHLAMQSMMQEAERTQAGRAESLGQRMDNALSSQDAKIRHLTDTVNRQLNFSDEKIERMRVSVQNSLNTIQKESSEKLDAMRKTVDETLKQTLTKSVGESFSLVNERLEQVYKGLGEMQTLAVGVGDLKRLFSNVKTRGVWGEMQLGTLLQDILAPEQYEANVAVKPDTRERVEYAICLPGKEGTGMYLPIDAKFPLEAYIRLQDAVEAGDDAAAKKASDELASIITREAGRISDKYISPPNTTDFAIMYLPMEALYAYVMQLSGTVEALQREKHVVISGPSTLSALLNSLQMGFRTLAIEKRSSDVWILLRDLQKEFASFESLLSKTSQRLKQASESVDSASRKTRTIERKLRNVEKIDMEINSIEEDDDEFENIDTLPE